MLELDDVVTFYGSSQALWGVSLKVGDEEVVGLIGRNGAGKTTTLRSIVGTQPPSTGTITFDGTDVTDEDPASIARRGINMVPEDRRPFATLTVDENLRLSHNTHHGNDWTLDRIYDEFPQLYERQEQKADQLSGGEQQMLVIAMALLTNPRLLLLDEPMEGLAPKIVEQITDIVRRVKSNGIPILLVEQNVDVCLDLADRGYLIHKGDIKHSGPSETFTNGSTDIKQYLSF
jgi:branched-chain amino acid transport system ATP-binding protein